MKLFRRRPKTYPIFQLTTVGQLKPGMHVIIKRYGSDYTVTHEGTVVETYIFPSRTEVLLKGMKNPLPIRMFGSITEVIE